MTGGLLGCTEEGALTVETAQDQTLSNMHWAIAISRFGETGVSTGIEVEQRRFGSTDGSNMLGQCCMLYFLDSEHQFAAFLFNSGHIAIGTKHAMPP